MRQLFWAATAVLIFAACGQPEAFDPGDPVLAKVHQRELRLSEMEGMFPDNASAADSAVIIEAFANRWARDAVLLWESEQNAPSDLNLDRLVRDYRASLVRSSYEEALVSTKLDSSITDAELRDFYADTREEYQLETPIVRCLFLRVPYPTPEEESLQTLWNNGKPEDTVALRDYARKYAEVFLLDDSEWYGLQQIASQLPEGTLTGDNVETKREFTQLDGTNRYYFRLFELKQTTEIAPLSYVEDQVRRAILHVRKRAVLEDTREEIFERELRRDNIQFFTNR